MQTNIRLILHWSGVVVLRSIVWSLYDEIMGNMCVAQWGCQEVRHPIYLKHTANKSACFLHRASSTRFNLSSGYCSAVLSTSFFHWSVSPIGQLESVSCTIMGVLIFTKNRLSSLCFCYSFIP